MFFVVFIFKFSVALAILNPRKEDEYNRLVIYFTQLLKAGVSPEQVLESVNYNSMPPIVKTGYLHALLSTGQTLYYKPSCVENHRFYYENQRRLKFIKP